MAAEPFYSVGPHDVFPEQFPNFLFPPGKARDLFLSAHGDLAQVDFWNRIQERVRAGVMEEVFPNPRPSASAIDSPRADCDGLDSVGEETANAGNSSAAERGNLSGFLAAPRTFRASCCAVFLEACELRASGL